MAIVRAVVVAALAASLVACADDGGDTAPTDPPRASTAEPSPEVTYLPAGDLPDPLTLRDVDGRTITARPFADFAVASGSGVWVSGVAPGAVRYDDTSGADHRAHPRPRRRDAGPRGVGRRGLRAHGRAQRAPAPRRRHR